MTDKTPAAKAPATKHVEKEPLETPIDDTEDTAAEHGNAAVPHEGDHDRVGMLSLRADGTPDQHNPEIIGDKEAALAATKEQFKQQAVSAVDVQNAPTVDEAEQDPTIVAKQDEHKKVAAAAEKAATSVVDSLHKG